MQIQEHHMMSELGLHILLQCTVQSKEVAAYQNIYCCIITNLNTYQETKGSLFFSMFGKNEDEKRIQVKLDGHVLSI
jgi:hypothetical protein